MFKKILIANRGEIACRVIRTARRMGVKTVAIYSDADRNALHVSMADEAVHVGAPPPLESYLLRERIIEACAKTSAEAVHPGYGFLSENAGFSRMCKDQGIVFIGPPEAAIEAMGSKSAAKTIMLAAGVAVVPGYHGDEQSPARIRSAAEEIGYPVLLKAVAGGGGKGMRLVRSAGEFDQAYAAARREAASSFGSDDLLVEKYLSRPRHVEFQIFCDRHGNAVYLFERDCSIQRRHQKVIEEAPAPGMSPDLRLQMGQAAVQAARAIDYEGAGTVEFLLERDGSFYFMEMNTRLQVEHPVTEMITGQDLVEWQLQIASGEPLPVQQDELEIHGHAFEARIYAEDPDRGFLPATGTISHLRQPSDSPHVRVDTGVREGDEISINYDPMIAKVIAWDVDRPSALRRVRGALGEYEIVGPKTNVSFLLDLSAQHAVAGADVEPSLLETGLIERYRKELFPDPKTASDAVLSLAVLSELLHVDKQARDAAAESTDPYSPWHRRDGWRLNQDNHHTFAFIDRGQRVAVTAHYRESGYLLELPGGETLVSGEHTGDNRMVADLNGVRIDATVVREPHALTVFAFGSSHRLDREQHTITEDEEPGGLLVSPLPGSVAQVLVETGQKVDKGQPLMIVEAMKMEHTISAPHGGRVARIYFALGDQVAEGAQLLAIEET